MGAMRKLAIMPMALLALACGKASQPENAALSDVLRGDLDRAAAPTSDLAAAQFKPTQVVSAVELGNAPAPRSSAVPRKRPVRRARPSPKPQVEQVQAVAHEPSPAPTSITIAAAPVPTTPGPRPTPNPVDYPAGSGDDVGGDDAGGIWRVIGVILRGGGIGDDDHCEIHRPGSIPIAINQRIPFPVGHPTYPGPRGGW
jgi:hypothetical protein